MTEPTSGGVGMGYYFYPRGGAAYVARYLASILQSRGRDVALVSGSLGSDGDLTHAGSFFAGVHGLRVVDYSPAGAAFESGQDPLAHTPPYHASYEERGNVPDRVLAEMSPLVHDHQADFWSREFSEADFGSRSLLHLHHITPQADAAISIGAPFLLHLHGTELKLLQDVLASPRRWTFGSHWDESYRRIARGARHLVAVSPDDAELAVELLGLDSSKVSVIPNGVDVEAFSALGLSPARRLACWRRWLVDDPRGWTVGGEPGSIRYEAADLGSFWDATTDEPAVVLLCVSRFLEFKRVPMLIRAYAAAKPRFERPAPLVVWGGFPGELEGEHPYDVAQSLGVSDVFFVGFRGYEDLNEGLNCADLIVHPARHEPFGQLLIQAMAAGRPVVAAKVGGPRLFIDPGPGPARNGWLFEPEDFDGLVASILAAVNSESERRHRGAEAARAVRSRFDWLAVANRFEELYDSLAT